SLLNRGATFLVVGSKRDSIPGNGRNPNDGGDRHSPSLARRRRRDPAHRPRRCPRDGDRRGRPPQRQRPCPLQPLQPFVQPPTQRGPRDRRADGSVQADAGRRHRRCAPGGAVQLQTQTPVLQNLATAVELDRTIGTAVDRPRVVVGRRANPDAVDEVNVGESLATLMHVGVGDHLDLDSFTPAQIAAFQRGDPNASPTPEGPPVRLRIVGIVRRPLDLGDLGGAGGVVLLSPAFHRKYGTDIGTFQGDILRVRTRRAADLPAVSAAAQRIFGTSPDYGLQSLAIESEGARNAIDVLTVALYVFAAVAAVAGFVAIGIVLNREVSISAADEPTLQALGTSRRQRVAI